MPVETNIAGVEGIAIKKKHFECLGYDFQWLTLSESFLSNPGTRSYWGAIKQQQTSTLDSIETLNAGALLI